MALCHTGSGGAGGGTALFFLKREPDREGALAALFSLLWALLWSQRGWHGMAVGTFFIFPGIDDLFSASVPSGERTTVGLKLELLFLTSSSLH